MSDAYLNLVNSGFTKKIAKQLGLPRPAVLRRTDPTHVDEPLTVGPVVVLGTGAEADALAKDLLEWDLDVRRSNPRGSRVGAIVLALTELTDPEQASAPVLEAAAMLRDLAPNGRVVTVSRPVGEGDDPTVAAARGGVEGLLRSLAKELRAGATGNGILVADGVGPDAPGVRGALRFFLSAKSAFVDGQLLTVATDEGRLPADWTRPLAAQPGDCPCPRVAVVTGAAQGIGAQIARVLARDGAEVIGVDVPAAGENLARVMNEIGGIALQLDITAPDAGQRILDLAQARHGLLDIVVHNAGITRDKLLANMTPDKWDAVVAVNVEAQLRMNEVFAQAADVSPHGMRIISLASTSGIAGNRGQTNYGFSKAAVIGSTQALARRLRAASDIAPATANAVAPGFIETEMTARIPALTRQVARRLNSLQQGGQPVDVAEAIAFLASPQAGGISGEVLRVCGQNLVGK